MASISLSGVWLAQESDLATTIELDRAITVDASAYKQGEFRRYAGGRTRLVTRTGDSQSVNVTAQYVTKANRATLDSWAGSLMLYRDGRGRLFFGSFLGLATSEVPGYQDLCNVSFTFDEVTHSIEV